MEPQPAGQCTLANFGGNLRWQARCYRPRDEPAVLGILARHRGEKIRAFGSLHSWSDIAMVSGVAIDMSLLNSVEPISGGVRVAAGCTLAKLLVDLHHATGSTLPTLGAIKRQTISGMISTATHGSGTPSVSHFVTRVRLAAYGSDGTPKVLDCAGGDELLAARCALGCLGVILSVDLVTVPKYRVRETIRRLDRVSAALPLYEAHPLTQFALVPHAWTVVAWERQRVPPQAGADSWLKALAFRFINAWIVDRVFHWVLIGCVASGQAAIRALLKMLPRMLLADVPRIDDSEHVLTLRHELFQHEEMELFVPESKVVQAAEALENALKVFAGDAASFSPEHEVKLRNEGLYDELIRRRGTHVHHYPIAFRRVLPEDALLSMAGLATEPWFSISLFTYYAPRKRQAFYAVCSWCARAMYVLFEAKLHWGKHFPPDAPQGARMYPGVERFLEIVRAADPGGSFRNDFTDRVLRSE